MSIRAVCLLALITAVIFMQFTVPARAIEAVQGAPDGFEQLQQPRQTSLTVYYGGDILGNFLAHSTPGSVKFDEPAKLLAAIPNLVNPEHVLAVLSQPLPANVSSLCTAKRVDDCGNLTPDVAGIIFDETSLGAELFINKNYLSLTDQGMARYLPLPDKHESSVYAFDGAVNGMNASTPNFNLANNATLSMGEAMLNTETTVSDNGLRFDTAAASVERNGWRAMGGLFRSRGMKLLSDRDIAGVSYGTSMRTRLDQQRVRGNDIILYLARRSFVSIYREGRLYSSRAYEAGNQLIDTSELPEGAYDILLKIQEASGTVREERRFFAKTEDLPPPDAPSYVIQGGFIRKPVEQGKTLPEITDKPILRAGMIRRLSDNIGLTTSLLGLQDRAVAETGPFIIFKGARIGVTGLASTKGDHGFQLSYLQAMSDFSISADVRRLWTSKTPMPGYEDVVGSMTQASMTVGYAITHDITIGAKSSYTARAQLPTVISAGPYAQWNIWQRGESMLIADATMSRTGTANEGNMMLRFSHKFGNYGISGSAGQLMSPQGNGPTANTRVWHEDNTPGDKLILGGGVSGDNQSRAVSADADWDNNFGQVRGGMQQSFGQGNSNFSYGGNFAFNAAQVADEVHVGGTQSSPSAVVIETDGDAEMPMKVQIDGIDRTVVEAGAKQVIYLPPFHTYRVKLTPTKAGLVDYGTAEQKVTLYPGNVVKLHWSVNKFYVVVGKIVTADGQTLGDAILQEGNEQAATDDAGNIQAELAAPKVMNFTTLDNKRCMVTLPSTADLNGVLIYKQPLVCK